MASSPIVMPPDANIPYEWQNGIDQGRMSIIVPSWSRKDKMSYLVLLDLKTRELVCECKGFELRRDCHHVRGVKWFCAQPMYRRRGVQRTSLEAYFTLTDRQIGDSQRMVLKVITDLGPISDKQIAMVLGWPINTVTPRRGELVEMGRVRYDSEGLDKDTNRTVMLWKAVE